MKPNNITTNLDRLVADNNAWQESISVEIEGFEEANRNGNVTDEMVERINDIRYETARRYEEITAATAEFVEFQQDTYFHFLNAVLLMGVSYEGYLVAVG
jgi:hypothetical protein